MDSVLGLVVFGSIAAGGVYYCQKSGGKSNKGSKKSTTTTNHTKEADVEDLDDFLPLKKKKQAPIITKLPEKPKKEKKAPEPQQQPQQQQQQPQQPEKTQTNKKGDKKVSEVVAPVVTAPKKDDKKTTATEAPRKLTEIEILKQRIADLESSKKVAEPISNKQAKKDAKAAAAAAAAAAEVATTAQSTKKDDKKAKEHNPAPQMTEDQKKEQEQALAQFQREQSQWREIPQDNRVKNKKSKDKHNYVDLSVLTIQSSITAKFGDRRALVFADDKTSVDESPKNKSSPIEQVSKVSGCKIDLQQRPTKEIMDKSPNKGADLPMKIDLEGTQEQIDVARAIITELITKGFSTKLTPNVTDAKLRVDPADHFQIVGKSGANINKIMDATGTKITVPQRAKEGQQQDDIVRIVGSADGVQAARDAIKSLITNGYSDLTHDNWTKAIIQFPATFRRYILQGGATSLIRAIETNSTCKLNLPTEQTDNTITIVGPANKVDQATADIKAVLQKLEAPVNDVFLVGFDCGDFKTNELW